MNIRVEIFTEGDSSEYKASRGAQAKLNDFIQDTPMERIVSITTNTAHSMTPHQETWFVYTLTLVYEPQAEPFTSEVQEKLDDIVHRLTGASDRLSRIHKDDTLSHVDEAIYFALNTLDELNAEHRA